MCLNGYLCIKFWCNRLCWHSIKMFNNYSARAFVSSLVQRFSLASTINIVKCWNRSQFFMLHSCMISSIDTWYFTHINKQKLMKQKAKWIKNDSRTETKWNEWDRGRQNEVLSAHTNLCIRAARNWEKQFLGQK